MTVTTEDVDLGTSTSDRAITRNRFLRYVSIVTVGLVARDIVAAAPAAAVGSGPACCNGGSCPHCWSNGCPNSYCETWYSGCGPLHYGWNICCNHQWNFCHDYIWRATGQQCVCVVYCGFNCPC